jgi:hypothetical protein
LTCIKVATTIKQLMRHARIIQAGVSKMARRSEDAAAAPLNANFSDLADVGVRQLEAFAQAQTAFTQKIQEANANWLKRLQTEGALASELGTKLTGARTFPEAAAAWQDWISRHVELANEDAKRVAGDTQEFLKTGALAFTGGWGGAGIERSTGVS